MTWGDALHELLTKSLKVEKAATFTKFIEGVNGEERLPLYVYKLLTFYKDDPRRTENLESALAKPIESSASQSKLGGVYVLARNPENKNAFACELSLTLHPVSNASASLSGRALLLYQGLLRSPVLERAADFRKALKAGCKACGVDATKYVASVSLLKEHQQALDRVEDAHYGSFSATIALLTYGALTHQLADQSFFVTGTIDETTLTLGKIAEFVTKLGILRGTDAILIAPRANEGELFNLPMVGAGEEVTQSEAQEWVNDHRLVFVDTLFDAITAIGWKNTEGYRSQYYVGVSPPSPTPWSPSNGEIELVKKTSGLNMSFFDELKRGLTPLKLVVRAETVGRPALEWYVEPSLDISKVKAPQGLFNTDGRDVKLAFAGSILERANLQNHCVGFMDKVYANFSVEDKGLLSEHTIGALAMLEKASSCFSCAKEVDRCPNCELDSHPYNRQLTALKKRLTNDSCPKILAPNSADVLEAATVVALLLKAYAGVFESCPRSHTHVTTCWRDLVSMTKKLIVSKTNELIPVSALLFHLVGALEWVAYLYAPNIFRISKVWEKKRDEPDLNDFVSVLGYLLDSTRATLRKENNDFLLICLEVVWAASWIGIVTGAEKMSTILEAFLRTARAEPPLLVLNQAHIFS